MFVSTPAQAKRVSVIAKGKRAKAAVFAGRKEKTIGGLTKVRDQRGANGGLRQLLEGRWGMTGLVS